VIELKTVYFEDTGVANTDEVLRVAGERAEQLGVAKIVVASTTGKTAVKAMDVFKGRKVIVVSHSAGFKEPGTQELTEENRKIIESKGGLIVTAAHAFGGLNRAMRQNLIEAAPRAYVIGDILANTLRIFGQGMKVACEVAVMAADAGLVRTDEDIIAIAGTGGDHPLGGSDVAIVVRPAPAHLVFEMRVREILCKPHF